MPIRDILCDSNGERLISSGANYAFADGIAAVDQGIRCRVSLLLGEYWLDESLGVPWLQEVLVKNPQAIVVKSVIGAAISDTPDVQNVTAFEFAIDAATRRGTVSYTAFTTAGTVTATIGSP